MSDNHFSGADRAAGYGIESLEATQKPPATTWRRDEEPEAAEPAPVITAPPSVEAIAPAPEYVEVVEQLGGQVIPLSTSSAEIQVSPADVLAGLTRSDLRTAARPVAKTGMRGFWARLGLKLEPSVAEKAQLEAAAEIAREDGDDALEAKLREAGIIAEPSGADAVLSRLKKKIED